MKKKLLLSFLFIIGTIFSEIAFMNNLNKNNIQPKIIEKETRYNTHLEGLDTSLVNTYKGNLHTMSPYTIVAPINSINELQKYSVVKAKPASLILRINKNINLVNENNEEIGISLKEAFESYIKNKMIPLIYISSLDVANAFIEYYPTNMNILDMAIVSDAPALIKMVRKANNVIRGILDYSNTSISKDDWYTTIKEANMSFANTIILNEHDATKEAITYIQARLKTVWVNVKNYTPLKTIQQINNGVSGIVSSDVDAIFATTNAFLKTDNVLRNLNRRPYFIAHRGVLHNYENSLEGFIEAIEYGATHIELDVQVTKDNKLALMHDASIDRTTTGSGKISDYTYDELKNFKIDSSPEGELPGEGVKIPLLDDIIEYCLDKDVVVVIEIKTYDSNVVPLIRECLERYNAFDKAVIISFYPDQLEKVKNLIPEVPLSTIGSVSYINLAEDLQKLAKMNSAVNTTKDNSYSELYRYLMDRGYATWHWTYPTANDVYKGITFGVNGLTNDCAEQLNNFAYELYSEGEISVDSYDNIEVELKCKTYDGSNITSLVSTPLYIEKHEDFAYAIFTASYEITFDDATYQFCIFSDVIKLVK